MPHHPPYSDPGDMTDSPAARLVLAIAWFALVASALVLLGQGLAAGFYIENTDTALAEAARGERLVSIACALLVLGAVLAMAGTWPWWVAVGCSCRSCSAAGSRPSRRSRCSRSCPLSSPTRLPCAPGSAGS